MTFRLHHPGMRSPACRNDAPARSRGSDRGTRKRWWRPSASPPAPACVDRRARIAPAHGCALVDLSAGEAPRCRPRARHGAHHRLGRHRANSIGEEFLLHSRPVHPDGRRRSCGFHQDTGRSGSLELSNGCYPFTVSRHGGQCLAKRGESRRTIGTTSSDGRSKAGPSPATADPARRIRGPVAPPDDRGPARLIPGCSVLPGPKQARASILATVRDDPGFGEQPGYPRLDHSRPVAGRRRALARRES